MTDMQIIQNFLEGVQESGKTTTAYDTTAEVIRVDENSVWVHIPGGVAETPVARTINAKKGDVVQVRVSGGTAFIVGNATAPPTDDATAIVAQGTADVAKETADVAKEVADAAMTSAEIAATAADNAMQSATEAEASATTAQTAANNALVQLSTIEDVVGILNWISQHGEYQASTDTEVVAGKFYFTRTGSGTSGDPYVYTVVENPTGNPSTSGYYELADVDEAVAAFVSSHLVLVSDGLYVIGTANGWKALVSSGDGNYPAGFYLIDPNGADIAAAFKSEGIQIGKDGESHLDMDYHSLQLTDQNGDTYFHVSDLRDAQGAITETFTGDGTEIYFLLSFYVDPDGGDVAYVKINNVETSAYRLVLDMEGIVLEFTTPPANGAEIEIKYIPEPEEISTHAFTFGSRKSNYEIGYGSVAAGASVAANGSCSHAEGAGTIAKGRYSHAEGWNTLANGSISHAEGNQTQANGAYSHAEGHYTIANGVCSHAQNFDTIASSDSQTVIGKDNIEDANNVYSFIIGNGSNSYNRSNAFAVKWDGTVDVAGVKAINSSGKAVKAVGDKNGNDITTTYVKNAAVGVTNLNDAATIGFYSYSAGATNAPTTTAGGNLLVIYNGGNYLHQIAEPFSSQDLYVRYKSGSSWSAWKRVGYIDDAPTWTAPTFTSNRATNMSGGFFTIGKMVYVQMIIKMNVSYTSGTTVDHSMIVNNIPSPLVTTAFTVTNRTSGVPISMHSNYGEGGIRLSIIASQYPLKKDDEIVITGQYIKA